MALRSIVLHVTGFLWRFWVFRVACFICVQRGWFHRPIGLYTPFWFALRKAMLEAGELHLAAQARETEQYYARLWRVAFR